MTGIPCWTRSPSRGKRFGIAQGGIPAQILGWNWDFSPSPAWMRRFSSRISQFPLIPGSRRGFQGVFPTGFDTDSGFHLFFGGVFPNQNPKIPPFSQRKIPPSRSEELGAAASDLQHHPRTWKILTQPQKFHVFPQEFPAFPPNYTQHRRRVRIPRFWVLFPVFISINYRHLPARWGRAQAGIPGNAGPGLPNPHV